MEEEEVKYDEFGKPITTGEDVLKQKLRNESANDVPIDVKNSSIPGKEMSIYDVGLDPKERPTPERFLYLNASENVVFNSDTNDGWNKFIERNPKFNALPESVRNSYKKGIEENYKMAISGMVAPDPTKFSNDPLTRMDLYKLPENKFSKGVVLTSGDPTRFQTAWDIPIATRDQVASSSPFALTKKGILVSSRDFIANSNRNRMALKEINDETTGAKTWVWEEIKDNEWRPANDIQSMYGDRTVDAGTNLGSFGRGFSSALVGNTASGVGWLFGNVSDLFSDETDNWAKRLENNSANFAAAMRHQNITEQNGPFDNLKSFMFQFGDGTGQLSQMLLISYATGGAASFMNVGQKGVSLMSKIAGLTVASSGKGAMMKNQMMAEGIPIDVASKVSLGMALTAAATESFIGPNVLLDPLKNRYAGKKFVDFIAKNVIDEKFLSASNLGKTQAVKNALYRFAESMDKYAITRGAMASIEEAGEELTENVLDLGVKHITNEIGVWDAKRNLKHFNSIQHEAVKDPVTGTVLYYRSFDGSGNEVRTTVEERNRMQKTIDNGGYFKSSEMSMGGTVNEMAMAAITSFPMGISSFYMSNKDFALDKGDIYDLATMLRTKQTSTKDVEAALEQLEKNKRIPSRHLDANGNVTADEQNSAFALYKKALFDEINTINAVMDKHGITSAKTIRAMSDANGLNRHVLHGALGAAEQMEVLLQAKQSLQNGEALTDNDYVKSTDGEKEIEEKINQAQVRLDYFTKPKTEKVEIGEEKITPEMSQGQTNYFMQNSMTYAAHEQVIKDAIYNKYQGINEPDKAKEKADSEFENRKVLGSLEHMIFNNVKTFVDDLKVRNNGLNVLDAFNNHKQEIEKLRKTYEEDFLAKKNQNNQNFLNVNKSLKSALEGIAKFAGLTQDEEASIVAKHAVNNANKISDINSEVQSLLEQLNQEDPEYDAKVQLINNDAQARIQAIEMNSKEAQNVEISEAKNSKNLNGILGGLDNLLSSLGQAQTTGIDESLKAQIETLMENTGQLDEQFLASIDPDLEEKIASIGTMVGSTEFKKNTIATDEAGNAISAELTQDEINQVFEDAIGNHFINPSAVKLAKDLADQIENGEEVTVSDEDRQLLTSLKNGVSDMAMYLYNNVNHHQQVIEKDNKTKEHSQLNNRTRISLDVQKTLHNYNGVVAHMVESILPKLGSDKEVNDKVRFKTTALHLNMANITSTVMITYPGIREIICEKEEMKKAGEDYLFKYQDAIGQFNSLNVDLLPKGGITDILQLIDIYSKTDNETFKVNCRNLLIQLEAINIEFQGAFYNTHKNTLHSATDENGNVVEGQEGLMHKILKAIDQKENDPEYALKLNLSYGYLNNEELYHLNYNDESEIIVRDKKLVNKDGQPVKSQLLPIVLLNNIFQWGTVDSVEGYKKILANITTQINENNTNTPIPTFEQTQAIFLTAAHMIDPSNEFFMEVVPQTKKDQWDEVQSEYIPNLLYVRGYAGSGKTTVIMRNAISIANLKESGKTNVVVIAPSKAVARLSFNTFSDINGFNDNEDAIITYNELVTGKKTIPAGTDIVIMDESTLLSTEEIIKSKDSISKVIDGKSTAKHSVIAIGDESQTRSEREVNTQPIRRAGKRSIPIIEQHRTVIRTIRNFQESMRDIVYSGKDRQLPGLEYVIHEGVKYGGQYLGTQEDVYTAFANDNDTSAILVVSTAKEVNELKKRFPDRNIYSTEFNINDSDSTCVSGLSAKRVYVAVDTREMFNIQTNVPNMVMTAASRAVEFLCVYDYHNTAVTNESTGTIPGLSDYLKQTNNFKEEAIAEKTRIEQLLGIKPTESAKPTLSNRIDINENRTITPLANSSQGYNNVMQRVKGFISNISHVNRSENDEDSFRNKADATVSDIVYADIPKENKEFSVGSIITKIIRRIVNNKIDVGANIQKAVADYNDGNDTNHKITHPDSKFNNLKGNYNIQSIAASNPNAIIIPTPFLQAKVTRDDKVITLAGSPIGIKIIGESNGKPVIQIIHIAKPAFQTGTDTYQEMTELLEKLSNGTYDATWLMTNYQEGTLSSAGQKMVDLLALYNTLIGDQAYVAGFEVMGVRNNWINDNPVTQPFGIKISTMLPAIAIALEKMKISPLPSLIATNEIEQGMVNDRVLTAEERKQVCINRNVTIKEGSLVSYTVEGQEVTATISDMFMRFDGGIGNVYLQLSNGEEVLASDVHVIKSYTGNSNRETALFQENQVYAGGYVRGLKHSPSVEESYDQVRSTLMTVINESVPTTRVKRTYKKSFAGGFGRNGSPIRHAIVYEVEDDVLDMAINRSGITVKDDAHRKELRDAHRVIAIERSAFWGEPYKSNRRLFARESKFGMIPGVVDQYLADHKLKELSELSESQKQELLEKVDDEIRSESGNPIIEISASIVREQLKFALEHADESSSTVTINQVDAGRPIFTPNEKDGSIPKTDLSNVIKAENERYEFDPILNIHYIPSNTTLSNGTKMSSKPIFTIIARDKVSGKSIPIRIFTETLGELNGEKKKGYFERLRTNLQEFFETINIDDNLPFEAFDDLEVKKFLDTNARRFIDILTNQGGTSKRVSAELANYITIHNGKYLRIKFASEGNNTTEKFYNALNSIIDILEKSDKAFADLYIPFETEDAGGMKKRLTNLASVKTLMHEEDGHYIGMNGFVMQLEGKKIVTAQVNDSANVTDYLDEGFGGEESFLGKKGQPGELIDESEARRIISHILGDKFLKENEDILASDLRHPVTGISLLGMVHKAKISLQEFKGGKVDFLAVRHEAMHIITSCILNDKSRAKLKQELGEDYLEKISELFEDESLVNKKTFVARAIAAIKHILYQLGVYKYDVNSLLYAAERGYFSNAVVHMDNEIMAKKYARYGDITPALNIFGSVDLMESFIETKMKLPFRDKMLTNRYYLRAGEDLGSAIKGTIAAYNQDLKNKKALEKGVIDPNDAFTRDELGQQVVTWIGESGEVTKLISEMNGDDYIDLYYNTEDGANRNDIAIKYLRYRLSDPNAIKSIIQYIFPSIDIDGLMIANTIEKNRQADRAKNGITSNTVINGEEFNEKRDVKTTLSPFLRFFISTVPYYSDIDFKGNTNQSISVRHSSQKGFVNYNTIHEAMLQAGEMMLELSDEPYVKQFIDNLKKIAIESRGEKRRAILSYLMEIGDLNIDNITSDLDGKKKIDTEGRLRMMAKTGYYGFIKTTNRDDREYAEKLHEKGTIILETILVPMVNSYRSSVTRNMAQVNENNEFKRITFDLVKEWSSVKGKIRSAVENKLYNDDGFVTNAARNKYEKTVAHNKMGSIGVIENGSFLPLLVVNPSTKKITFNNEVENLEYHLYRIVKAMGIDIKRDAWKTVFNDSFENKKSKFTVDDLAGNLWGAAAGVFINNSMGESLSEVDKLIARYEDTAKEEVSTRKEYLNKIKDILNVHEEAYKNTPTYHINQNDSGINVMKSMLREVYGDRGYTFQSAERAMSFGLENGTMEEFFSDNEELSRYSIFSYGSPNVMDLYKMINPMAASEMDIQDANSEQTTRNGNDDMVQRHILGSQFTEMLTRGARRLNSIINSIPTKFKNSVLFDGTGVSSIFTSNKKAIYPSHKPVFSLENFADFDSWIGRNAAIEFNKAPKGRVFETLINLGFIKELLMSNSENFYMMFDPHADKKNTRIGQVRQGSALQRIFTATKNKEVVEGSSEPIDITTVNINSKALVNAIGSNVDYALNNQKNSKAKWVRTINKWIEKQSKYVKSEKTLLKEQQEKEAYEKKIQEINDKYESELNKLKVKPIFEKADKIPSSVLSNKKITIDGGEISAKQFHDDVHEEINNLEKLLKCLLHE